MTSTPHGAPSARGRFTLRFTLVAAFTGITLLATLIFSLATTQLVSHFVRDEFRLRLTDLAAVAASQLDVARHHQLQSPADQGGANYQALQQQMRAIRDHGTNIRFIYTMRQRADGKVVFVVDGEETSADFSALGSVYDHVTPELLQMLNRPLASIKSVATADFYDDAWGTWMTAYAPLRLPDGRLDAVLALDVSASRVLAHERRYQYVVWGASALLSILFMPLAYLIAQRVRRPLAQLEADMAKVKLFNLESTPAIRSRIIEITDMARQLENMKSGLRSFQKYVPADLVRRLMARGVDAEIGGTQQEVTIFMSDVEGFTHLSERLVPTALVQHLSEYLTSVTGSLHTTGATVDKYIGDAVLAFWNAPEPAPDHALRACEAALLAQQGITELNRQWAAKGDAVVFKTRIGINTGNVIVGNIGSADRMSYTIIGDQVNLVSRLEAANKLYGTAILISEHTQEQVHAVYATRWVDQLVAYGTSVPIKVYELLGRHDQIAPSLRAIASNYEAAFLRYRQRDFAGALALLHPQQDGDPPSRVLAERCDGFIQNPPAPDWAGLHTLFSK